MIDALEPLFELFSPILVSLQDFIRTGSGQPGEFYARVIIWVILFLLFKIGIGLFSAKLGDSAVKPLKWVAALLGILGAVGIPAELLSTMFGMFGFLVFLGFVGFWIYIGFMLYKLVTKVFGTNPMFSFVFLAVAQVLLVILRNVVVKSFSSLQFIDTLFSLLITTMGAIVFVNFLLVLGHFFSGSSLSGKINFNGLRKAGVFVGVLGSGMLKGLKKLPGTTGKAFEYIKGSIPQKDMQNFLTKLAQEFVTFGKFIVYVQRSKVPEILKDFFDSGKLLEKDLNSYMKDLGKVSESEFKEKQFDAISKVFEVFKEIDFTSMKKIFEDKNAVFEFYSEDILKKLYAIIQESYKVIFAAVKDPKFSEYFPSRNEYKAEVTFAFDLKNIREESVKAEKNIFSLIEYLRDFPKAQEDVKKEFSDLEHEAVFSEELKNGIKNSFENSDFSYKSVEQLSNMLKNVTSISKSLKNSESKKDKKQFLKAFEKLKKIKSQIVSLKGILEYSLKKLDGYIIDSIKNYEHLHNDEMRNDSSIKQEVNNLSLFGNQIEELKKENFAGLVRIDTLRTFALELKKFIV
ncbi:hypothetical protein JXM83_01135 [Candidatus Woesearchaeota archaeon]|nr:hypothetical protein [Candidatus Woesearchaeota archaeon]